MGGKTSCKITVQRKKRGSPSGRKIRSVFDYSQKGSRGDRTRKGGENRDIVAMGGCGTGGGKSASGFAGGEGGGVKIQKSERGEMR